VFIEQDIEIKDRKKHMFENWDKLPNQEKPNKKKG